MNLGLYWEHDWTADGPVPRSDRAAWQEELATEIESYVNSLHADGAARSASLIARPGRAPRFYALNPLGWTRTDAADFRYDGPEDIHVHDLAAARDVPHQLVTLERNEVPPRPGERRAVGRVQGVRDAPRPRRRAARPGGVVRRATLSRTRA